MTDSSALRMVANPSGVPLQQRNRLTGITGGHPLEYLNGGVLVFDLDNPDFRELALRARALVVLQGHTLQQRDQDALNLAFAGRTHRLPSTYNYMTQFYVSERTLDGDLIQRKYDNADAVLVHFSGKVKPWIDVSDEFYNGLYRRLVSDAEEKLGVSCDFYFSRPRRAAGADWPVERWVEVLGTPAERLPPELAQKDDIALVDLCDRGIYLTLSTTMYELARATGLRLTATSQGRNLLDLPLAGVSSPLLHLSERVAPGVRFVPVDLREALAGAGGMTRNVELVVTSPRLDEQEGFTRSLGVMDVLAAGPAATERLLEQVGIEGELTSVSGGWLTGWLRPRSQGGTEAVSLFIDGELAARRVVYERAQGSRAGQGTYPFKFFAANLSRLGYGHGGEISVRLSGTNVPLRGGLLPVADVRRSMRYDARLDQWVRASSARPRARLRAAASGLRTRLRKQA